jgi:hypothetical protein
MRPRSLAPLLAAVAILVGGTVALAGGWAQVTASNVPADPPAGETTTIELEVLQHGVTAVSWPRLTVVATETSSGAVVRTTAQASGPEGSYVANVVFPSAGEWTLTYESVDLVMDGTAALRVAPPIGAAPSTTAPAEAGLGVLPQVLGVLAILLVLAVGVLALRGRSAAPGRVSART